MYKCHKQEFIPTPTPDLAATVAKIKAETTPFEFIGDVGDVMLCECSSSALQRLSKKSSLTRRARNRPPFDGALDRDQH